VIVKKVVKSSLGTKVNKKNALDPILLLINDDVG